MKTNKSLWGFKRIKIKKSLWKKHNITIIDIANIEIQYKMINEILDLFNYDNIILIADYIDEKDKIFGELDKQKIEYKKDIQCIKLTKRNSNILNMIPLDCDLFITGYNSNFDVDLAFSNIINLPYDKFIETGEIDFIIDFWNSEQQVRFEFNSLKYDSNYIMSELCNIIKKYNYNRNKIMFNKIKKKAIKIVLIFVLFCVLGNLFCLYLENTNPYITGPDTVKSFGNGRYQIIKIPASIDGKTQKFNILYDLKDDTTIESEILEFRHDEKNNLVYTFGDNGYTILNYKKEKYKQSKSCQDFTDEEQSIFFSCPHDISE